MENEKELIGKENLESIKLTKNAKGDMQYEIKVIDEKLGDSTLERLKNIYTKLEEQYGKDKERKD